MLHSVENEKKILIENKNSSNLVKQLLSRNFCQKSVSVNCTLLKLRKFTLIHAF